MLTNFWATIRKTVRTMLSDHCQSCPVGSIANLKGHYFQPSLSVCLSVCVCLWPALLPFQRWPILMKLGHKDLLWSSLAATIMVQIGRRISKFWSIIFLRLCLLCIVKKNSTGFEQNWRRRYILKFAIPATSCRSKPAASVLAAGVPALQQQWTVEMWGSRNVASASFRGFWPQICDGF